MLLEQINGKLICIVRSKDIQRSHKGHRMSKSIIKNNTFIKNAFDSILGFGLIKNLKSLARPPTLENLS